MATNEQIIDLLRSFRIEQDSRLADCANAGLMSAADGYSSATAAWAFYVEG